MTFIKYATGLSGLGQVLDVSCLFFFFRWSYNHLYQIYWVDPGPRQIQEPAFLLYVLQCSGQGTIVFWQRQTRK